jgi:surfeit locus 1 family protein
VSVRGQYDYSGQVALRNQVWDNQAGVHLLTPLKIEGTDTYVLVERGWVPGIESTPEDWRQYDEPGTVEVRGMIRRSQSKPDFGRRADQLPAPGESPLRLWYFANVEGISAQLSYPLLPVYIQQAPDLAWTALPYRSLPELELTEGPHMGYAMQWFSFAVLLLAGYPFFVRKREIKH